MILLKNIQLAGSVIMASNINNMTENKAMATGFAAIENSNAEILILGSMPSVESLKQQQYYAHPRNAFWPIMANLFQFDLDLPYQQRCIKLTEHHIAVWDVLQSCQRQGSLDSNIEESSIIANDFSTFLQQHPDIQQICFNGTKAEQVFNRHVLPMLSEQQRGIARSKLPSTSPAHAAMTFEQKLGLWWQALNL